MTTMRSRLQGLTPTEMVLAAATAVVLTFAASVIVRVGLFPYGVTIARPDGDAYDFGIFYRSTVALWTGGEMYTGGQPNFAPPATMVLLGPLAALPAVAAYRLFVLLSVAVLVGSMMWTALERRAPVAPAMVALAATVVGPALAVTLAQGQTYTLLAAGLTAGWLLDRRGHERGAGIALGLVVAFKPILLAVLLWPLLRGRPRGSVAGLVTAAAVTLVGVVVAGPSETVRYLEVLARGFPSQDYDNASLLTTGFRLFTAGRDIPPLVDAPLLGWSIALVAVAILVVTLLRAARHEMGFWAIVAACLLVSPLAWRGYLVLFAPAVLALLATRRTRWVGALLLALLAIPHQWSALFQDRTSIAYTLSTLLGPLVLLALWVAFFLVSTRSEPHDEGTDRQPEEARGVPQDRE